MPRYFLEIQYKGTKYNGLASQSKDSKAITIQGLIDDALSIILKSKVESTTSSRTDAGVHAMQNFLHFDTEILLPTKILYSINSILPNDIVVKNIQEVSDTAHCRFDAISREYKYYISTQKNAFKIETAWFFPYKVNLELLNLAANELMQHTNFESFSKKNTDVFTYNCKLTKSNWSIENDNILCYNVQGNRFLRGMVRALVGTMLHVGTGKISLTKFKEIILAKDCNKANFGTPAHGLFLEKVSYTDGYFNNIYL